MPALSESLRSILQDLFEPLITAAKNGAGRRALFRSIGHTEAVAGDPGLGTAIEQLAALIETISTLDTETLQSWSGITRLLEIGSQASKALGSLETASHDPALASRLAHLGEELTEQALARYLQDHGPVLFRAGAILTLITPADLAPPEAFVVEGSEFTRLPWRRSRFRFDRIEPLLKDPWRTLRESYFPNSLAAHADAHTAADLLFPHLGAAMGALDVSWRADVVPVNPPAPIPPVLEDPNSDHFSETEEPLDPVEKTMPPADLNEFHKRHRPQFVFALPSIAPGIASTGVALLVSSLQHDGGVSGIIVTPLGNLNVSHVFGPWRVALTASGQVPAFVAGPNGFALAPSSTGIAAGSLRLSVELVPEGAGPAFTFGSATGTRLEIGKFRIGADLTYSASQAAFSLTLDATSCALSIMPGDGDGFLKEVLPADGMRANFDIGLTLSSVGGFSFRGSAGLQVEIPVGLSAGNIVRIDSVRLGLAAASGGVRGDIATAGSVRLGPVTAVVDGLGITTELSFPATGRNLGPARLTVGFKPPNGIGLAIDASAVTGGGYLFFDSANEQYAGAIQLEIGNIALTAIGLLTTRMPDGSRGFSLIISITAQGFQPIQLGFGFRLSGVGGLIGVNRTVAVDVLRSGLKNGTLDSVLFPKDPLRNIAQIVSDMRRVFPPARGRFIFGPLLVIDWGTPPVLTMEVGVILELPSPVRLIILGQIRAALPKQDAAIVKLNMDVLGVLEFDKGELAIDAVLYDSRILTFAISGEMALRARWLTNPTFIMSAGGLNPHFKPPEGFPSLQRLAVSLSNGDNPRVRLEAYLALTSNTAQIGARLDLRVAVASFSVEGYLQFDALFEFSPFQFTADMKAGVTLKWHGRTLLGVQLELSLSGPTRWHAKGKATFKVWIFSKSVSFDKTFGKQEAPPVLPPGDPLPELLAALRDRRSWGGAVPGGGRALVSFREAPEGGDMMVHPLGQLAVRQRVVPLDIEISKFGNTAPAGERRFRITQVRLGDQQVTGARPLTDFFAPGQFLQLSDAQSLSRPSFEQLQSGVELAGALVKFGGQTDAALMATAESTYETVTFSPGGAFDKPKTKAALPKVALLAAAGVGSAARAGARGAGSAKYRGEQRDVSPRETGYVVALTADLTPAGESQGTSYTAAAQALAQKVAANQDLRGKLKIVARHELAGVGS